MAKPTAAEVTELLNYIAATYDELDMRLKTNETHFERIELGSNVWKVGFTFDDGDVMTIRIVNRTPVT